MVKCDVLSLLLPTFLRACAWPCQLGEHLLHELPAARLVCLPRFRQVARRVYCAVHRGAEGAPRTPVFILNTVAPVERYLDGNLKGIVCIFRNFRNLCVEKDHTDYYAKNTKSPIIQTYF